MSNNAHTTETEGPETLNYELSGLDRIAVSIDQPMGFGMFIVKNIVNATFSAIATAAVFKGLEYLKERKERKEQELSLVQGGAGNFRVAGE